MDEDGVVLAGPDEARAEAVRASGEMLRELGGRFWNSGQWRMWVVDESGDTICAFRFSAEG